MTFDAWLRFMWEQHCEEVEAWEGRPPCYSAREYFNKYKWWLKREYRHQSQTQSA